MLEMSKTKGFDEGLSITKLTDAFSPNIKSIHEAADIRRVIALHVASHITSHDSTSQHQSKIARSMGPFGKELVGLRRKYLETLRSNIEAQGRYHELLEDASTPSSIRETKDPDGRRTNALLIHLKHLQLHRNSRELQIRKHHAEALVEYGSYENTLGMKPPQHTKTNSENEDTKELQERIVAAASAVQDLAEELQKAVLQAKVQLGKEKAGLAEAKAKIRLAKHPSPGARLHAITNTRVELVQWLDDRLSQNTGEDAVISDIENFDGPSESSHPSQSISKYYSSYLSSRKTLLAAVTCATQVFPAHHTKATGVPNLDTKSSFKMTTSAHSTSTLLLVSQHLLPLLQHQTSASLFRTYTSSQSTAERTSSIDIISRLGQESQLLHEYPPLVSPNEKEDHITRLVSIWRSAAVAADRTLTDVVLRHVQQSLQAMAKSEQALSDVTKVRGEDEMSGWKKRNSNSKSLRPPGYGWRGFDGDLGTDREAI